jgi:hypothetical protein
VDRKHHIPLLLPLLAHGPAVGNAAGPVAIGPPFGVDATLADGGEVAVVAAGTFPDGVVRRGLLEQLALIGRVLLLLLGGVLVWGRLLWLLGAGHQQGRESGDPGGFGVGEAWVDIFIVVVA